MTEPKSPESGPHSRAVSIGSRERAALQARVEQYEQEMNSPLAQRIAQIEARLAAAETWQRDLKGEDPLLVANGVVKFRGEKGQGTVRINVAVNGQPGTMLVVGTQPARIL